MALYSVSIVLASSKYKSAESNSFLLTMISFFFFAPSSNLIPLIQLIYWLQLIAYDTSVLVVIL